MLKTRVAKRTVIKKPRFSAPVITTLRNELQKTANVASMDKIEIYIVITKHKKAIGLLNPYYIKDDLRTSKYTKETGLVNPYYTEVESLAWSCLQK